LGDACSASLGLACSGEMRGRPDRSSPCAAGRSLCRLAAARPWPRPSAAGCRGVWLRPWSLLPSALPSAPADGCPRCPFWGEGRPRGAFDIAFFGACLFLAGLVLAAPSALAEAPPPRRFAGEGRSRRPSAAGFLAESASRFVAEVCVFIEKIFPVLICW